MTVRRGGPVNRGCALSVRRGKSQTTPVRFARRVELGVRVRTAIARNAPMARSPIRQLFTVQRAHLGWAGLAAIVTSRSTFVRKEMWRVGILAKMVERATMANPRSAAFAQWGGKARHVSLSLSAQ